MLGNNLKASKLFRLRVPLFTNDAIINGVGNIKYFFPETPVLDHATIVGLEAHLSTQSTNLGDIDRYENGLQNVTKVNARTILVTIYGADKTQHFSSIPLISLFPNNGGTFKKVMPYYGTINTRMSYCLLTNPTGSELQDKYYVNLTFYYNPKRKK